jgi:hypothetical protein
MKILTSSIAAFICVIPAVLPWYVSGNLFASFGISMTVGFFVSYFTYVDQDDDGSSSLDAGSIVSSLYAGPFLRH